MRMLQRQLRSWQRREWLFRAVWGFARWTALVVVGLTVACTLDWLIDRSRDTPFFLRLLIQPREQPGARPRCGRLQQHACFQFRQAAVAQQTTIGFRHQIQAASPSAVSNSAWCSAANASMRSFMSPSMMAAILYSVRLMR